MSKHPIRRAFSRRALLQSLSFAPTAFLPAPVRMLGSFGADLRGGSHHFDFDFRIVPRYPAKSPLDDVMKFALPGTDAFVNEKYAFEIGKILQQWAKELQDGSAA